MATRNTKNCVKIALNKNCPEEIDKINIINTAMPAMKRSLEQMNISDEQIKSMIALIDGNTVRGFDCDVVPITEGDCKSMSVATASILAKVTRDRLCLELDKKYLQYGFAKHKGYPTKEHRDNIIKYGVSEVHRKIFLRFLDAAENKKDNLNGQKQ
jgi:ribonuclease HII